MTFLVVGTGCASLSSALLRLNDALIRIGRECGEFGILIDTEAADVAVGFNRPLRFSASHGRGVCWPCRIPFGRSQFDPIELHQGATRGARWPRGRRADESTDPGLSSRPRRENRLPGLLIGGAARSRGRGAFLPGASDSRLRTGQGAGNLFRTECEAFAHSTSFRHVSTVFGSARFAEDNSRYYALPETLEPAGTAGFSVMTGGVRA